MESRVCVCLSGRGIGNIVLMLAFALRVAREVGTAKPVVVAAPPGVRDRVAQNLFEFVDSPPDDYDCVMIDPVSACSLSFLRSPQTRAAMREVVLPDDSVDGADVDAGFSIRTANPTFDGDARFMNDVAIAAMKREMSKYRKVMVFTNDAANLVDLPANATVADCTRGDARNVDSHWAQWHALAKCPVVYHAISGDDGSMASTFAAVAAAYGDGVPMGVTNHGVVHCKGPFGDMDFWPKSGAVPDVDGHGVVHGLVCRTPSYRW